MRIAILTSGGDAPGMNAAVRAFTVVGLRRGHEVLGIHDGYAGLLRRDAVPLTAESTERLTRQGGTLLGSSRCLEMMEPAGQERALAALGELRLDGLCVVGGNGSLTGAHVLAPRTPCRVVGLPASIDNDVGHAGLAIGVDTAVNTIVEACDRITDTARAHRRAFVVEVMGRNCGFLAMRAGLAAEADAILYGEAHESEEAIYAHLRQVLRRCFVDRTDKKRALIVKSEGLSISAKAMRDHLQGFLDADAPGVDVRETVLGHVVRGGAPSALDRTIALRLGFSAVMALEAGRTDTMLAWEPPFQVGEETMDPSVRSVPIGEVLAETARLLDGSSALIRRRLELLRFVDDCLPG